jgi:hypothetical protein
LFHKKAFPKRIYNNDAKIMTTIDQKTVMEKYDEFSRLETLTERRQLFGKQSE